MERQQKAATSSGRLSQSVIVFEKKRENVPLSLPQNWLTDS